MQWGHPQPRSGERDAQRDEGGTSRLRGRAGQSTLVAVATDLGG
jgi:hypothetical protein